MKRLTLIIALGFILTQVQAAIITPSQAQQSACNLVSDLEGTGGSDLNSELLLTITTQELDPRPVLYVFNVHEHASLQGHFVIVSGDSNADEVLAYGDGLLDINNIPDGLQYLLNRYKEQIEVIIEENNPDNGTSTRSHPVVPSNLEPIEQMLFKVSELLTTKWGQWNPYNNQCPVDPANNRRYPTGCGATAMAQVMKYWEYPKGEIAPLEGYTKGGKMYNTLEGISGFDWENMLDEYKDITIPAEKKDAVAQLMRYAGHAQHMNYNSSSYSILEDIGTALNTFGYNAYCYDRKNYDDNHWENMMLREFNVTPPRPIIYSGLSFDDNNVIESAHFFVIDGYTLSLDGSMFHINFGWEGNGNGHFQLGNFKGVINDSISYLYNRGEMMITGIDNIPKLTVEPDSLSMNGYRFVSTTDTIFIKGNAAFAYLQKDVNISISGDTQSFSVYPSTLTSREVMEGAAIIVTYRPLQAGSSSATITIESDAINTPYIVNLTGSAPWSIPYVNSSDEELVFEDGHTGYGQTKTFTVRGRITVVDEETGSINYVPLVHNIELSVLSDDDTCPFTVSPNILTPEAAFSGATVTVTFKPTQNGESSAYILLSCDDIADDTYIGLAGISNSLAHIETDQSSIHFEGVTSYTYSKVFHVQGYNLTNDIDVNLDWQVTSDGNSSVRSCYYTISPTTITAEQASQGVPVTVTYFGSGFNTTKGTITLSCPDTEDIIIPLSGRISYPSFGVEADSTSLTFESAPGMPVTQSFEVRCEEYLYGNTMLNQPNGTGDGNQMLLGSINSDDFAIELSGDNDVFSVRIVPNPITNKNYVYVTFDAPRAGEYHATLTLKYMEDESSSRPFDVELTGFAYQLNSILMGDVNDDGKVSITDVTALINALLSNNWDNLNYNAADVDQDGKVSITDVTALINLLLTSNQQ